MHKENQNWEKISRSHFQKKLDMNQEDCNQCIYSWNLSLYKLWSYDLFILYIYGLFILKFLHALSVSKPIIIILILAHS